jgi:hypothetical protein
MATRSRHLEETDPVEILVEHNYLFRDFEVSWLKTYLSPESVTREKLYSNRPIYTAFQSERPLNVLYTIAAGGPIITRSTPLDRIIMLSYAGGCFGMRSLPFGHGAVYHAFPSQVEAYKTADVFKIASEAVQSLYQKSDIFRKRYDLLFELREKFQYHLLNCSTYPPQAVAALLRALIYQERELGNQPDSQGIYLFDLPIDIIARASQLNNRTVEQVLKGMRQVGLIEPVQPDDSSDVLRISDPEGLKETYSATRDKVSWWPLR